MSLKELFAEFLVVLEKLRIILEVIKKAQN